MTDGAPGAVLLADIAPVLTLFAQAVAGRAITLEPIAEAPERGQPDRVMFDGELIHLPAELALFPVARHNRGAYWAIVLHQLGYVQFGTFAADVSEFLGPVRPPLLGQIFLVLEDLRIDSAIRHHYPGARGDVDRVLTHALAQRPASFEHLPPWRWLLEALLRWSLGADADLLVAADPTGWCATAVFDAAAAVTRPDATVHDTADATRTIFALLDSVLAAARQAAAANGDGDGDADDDGALVELVPEPTAEESTAPSVYVPMPSEGEAQPAADLFDFGSIDFRGELNDDLVYQSAQASSSGDAPQDVDQAVAEGADPSEVVEAEPVAGGRKVGGSSRLLADRTYFYDEWDHEHVRYIRAWCELHEHRLRGDDFGYLTEVRRRHSVLAAQVRRGFRFMRPEAWQRIHRVTDGDEIELDAAIDAMVTRRAGHSTDERLYMRRDRARREVATAFLMDLSASTGSPVVDPNAPPPVYADPESLEYPYFTPDDDRNKDPDRRVIDIAKESLALMCDALHLLGDQHAVYGFSGAGHDDVEFHVAKEFDDEPSPRTWAALAAMEPRRYTRMGPAIRHATHKIVQQPYRTKLLIVVSDGYPQDSDYGPVPGDKEYGLQDTARALVEAEHAGVSTFCVTIDPAGNDYLRRMCPEHKYAVIDDVTALPGELAKLYRSLSAPAAASARPTAHRRPA